VLNMLASRLSLLTTTWSMPSSRKSRRTERQFFDSH
jgi:hypothetical protein